MNTVLTINGVGFTSDSTIALVADNGIAYTAANSSLDFIGEMTDDFNANAVPSGLYSVRVTDPYYGTTVLSNAFTMVATGAPHMITDLVVPGWVGRHGTATTFSEYSNDGDAAMPAPLLLLTGTENPFLTLDATRITAGLWTSALPEGFSHTVQFLACGYTPGVLQPGESFQVPVYYAGLQQPWTWNSQVSFNLGVITADNANVIDWDSLRDGMKPSTLSADAWDALWIGFTKHIGNTWGNYVQTLDNNASYLGRLGLRVVDVGELLQFELLQADGIGPVRTLSSVVDAAVETPGLPLVFARSCASGISQRNQVGPLGRGWAHNWQLSLNNASDGTVTIMGPAGSQRVFQPDSRNGNYFTQAGDHGTLARLSGGAFKLTEVNGIATVFSADGTLNYVADPNGNRITAGYAGGQLVRLTHSSGQYLQIGYDGNGHIQTVTDSLNRQALFNYDGTGEHLTMTRDYAERYTTNSYVTGQGIAREHALQSIAYPGGTHQYYAFDADGRLSAAWRDGNTEPVWLGYDLGKVMVTNGASKVTQYYFDHHGLLVKAEDALGDPVYLARDNQFNLTSTTDPVGRSYGYGYDTRGNATSSLDPLRNVTRFTYTTGLNRLSTLQDANANQTGYGYDAKGNLQSITYADHSVESWGHDSAGNTLVWTNRRGQPIYYTNDANGRLTAKLYPSGKLIRYGYDAHGNLTNATTIDPSQAATNIIQLSYDSKDQLTHIAYPKGRWLAFTYYDSGQRASSEDHLGHHTGYHYDSAGRLESLIDENGVEVIRYFYDLAGRLSGKKTANGNYTTNIFDDAGQLLRLINFKNDGSVNSRFDYSYDSRGRRKSMQTVDGNWTYHYDDLGQLTNAVFASGNASIPNQNLTYIYDPLGNRLSTISNGVVTAYSPNELNQYERVGDTVNSYDADGNLRLAVSPTGTSRYTFNEENRLVGVTTPAGTWEYEYDAFGNRVAVVENGQRTEFLVDPAGMGNVVGEFDDTGALTASYTHGFGLVSREDAGNGKAFYDFDAIGSTSGMSANDGGYQNRYSYLPFGETQIKIQGVPNSFRYVGQLGVATEHNELHFMRARFYTSSTGRFESADPINLLGECVNPYTYSHNCPSYLNDPSGLISQARYTEEWRAYMDFRMRRRNGENYLSVAWDHVAWNGRGKWSHHDFTPSAVDVEWLTTLNLVTAPFMGNPIPYELIAYAGLKIPQILGASWYDAWNLWKTRDTINTIANVSDFSHWNAIFLAYKDRMDFWGGGGGVLKLVTSGDPNDKLCPAGYGTNAFIRPNSLMPYMIRFENDTNATAPAQQVTVTDPLSTNLDWSSFELTELGFGDTIIPVPAHSQYFETTVPMTYNDVSFDVDIYAGIDQETGKVYADFYSIDPLTSLPPGVMIGFLPPEDGTGRGQGHVSFTIRAMTNLATGTIIRNVADISFDNQEIISTDQINPHDASQGFDLSKGINTIDSSAPTSFVASLPYVSTNTDFIVRWSGTDAGAGIVSYDIYVASNGGVWKAWLTGTTNSSLSFQGVMGNRYSFYSIARDGVGNVETAPTLADATTIVAPHLPPEFEPLAETNQNQFAAVGGHISFTNTAHSPNLPITYSLDSSAPAGASISTNGVFSWTPSCGQGSTTNVIRIWATDSYGIPLSNSISFVVAVSECLQLNVGSTVLQVGHTSSVPLSIISTLNLTNLSFTVVYPTNRFTNWIITPSHTAIGGTWVQSIDSAQTAFNLAAKEGQTFNGPSVLGWLTFKALSAPSAFVPLTFADVVGTKSDGSEVGNSSGQPGRVVVIGAEPLLEGWMASNSTRMLTLYGNPGSSYQIAFITNIASTNWQQAWRVPLTNLQQYYPVDQKASPIFYRAWEFFADPPLLELNQGTRTNLTLLLYGRSGTNYALQATTNLTGTPIWSTNISFTLTNSFRCMDVTNQSDGMMFFRAKSP